MHLKGTRRLVLPPEAGRAAPTTPGNAAATGNDDNATERRGLAPIVWVPGLIVLVLGMLIVVARL